MKKSKTNKNLKIENIVEDMNGLLTLLDDLNKTKLEDLNLDDMDEILEKAD